MDGAGLRLPSAARSLTPFPGLRGAGLPQAADDVPVAAYRSPIVPDLSLQVGAPPQPWSPWAFAPL